MVEGGRSAFLMIEGHGGCFQFIDPCIFYEKKGVETFLGHSSILKNELFNIQDRSFSRSLKLIGL